MFGLTSRGNLGLDAQVRYEVTRNLVRHGNFTAGEAGGIRWERHGEAVTYPVFGIGQSLLMVPVEAFVVLRLEHLAGRDLRRAAFALLSVILFPLLSATAMLLLFGLVCETGASPRAATLYTAMVALASPMLIYSGDGQEVTQIVGLLAGGTWLTLRAARKARVGLLLAAVCCFWAMPVFRTQHLLEALLFSGWACYQWRKSGPANSRLLAALIVPPIFCVTWLLAFNWIRFGHPLANPYTIIFEQRGIVPFSQPFWRGFLGPLVSPDKSILLYCPLLLAAFSRHRFLSGVFWLSTACFLVLCLSLARYVSWGGDHAIGPRLEMHLVPFLLLPLVPQLERARLPAWFKVLVLLSFVVQLAGKSLDPALEIDRNPHASTITPECSPQDGPGRWVNRFVNLAEKARGTLRPNWGRELGRPLSPLEESATQWDYFWGRAWQSGRTAGTAAVLLAALLFAAAVASALRLRKQIASL